MYYSYYIELAFLSGVACVFTTIIYRYMTYLYVPSKASRDIKISKIARKIILFSPPKYIFSLCSVKLFPDS